jgi:hypothetical protein
VDGGAKDVPVFPDEMRALRWMLEQSKPNDVVAITALNQREEIFALMGDRRAAPIDPPRVLQLVRAARG